MTIEQANLFIMQIAAYFGYRLSDITFDADFYNDLIMTPLMHSQVLLLAEDNFDVTIPASDGKKLTTVRKLVTYIDKKKRD